MLNSERVEYLVVGGYAVNYHGYVRTTGDMDIWVAINPDNAARLVTVVQQFGFSPASISAELFLKEGQIVRMGFPPARIEILTRVTGVEFADCYARRKTDCVDGVEIPLDDLKTNKRAAGRHKDLADLEQLP